MPSKSNKENIDQSEIAETLSGLHYPIFLNGIIIHAAEKGTRDAVLQILETLPRREYGSEAEIMKEIDAVVGR
jgi:uncharacterized protein YceH (UPF0502 family)